MRVILYQAVQIICDIACLPLFVYADLVLYDMSCGRPPTYWPLRAGIALAAMIGLLKLESIFDEEAEYESEKSGSGD